MGWDLIILNSSCFIFVNKDGDYLRVTCSLNTYVNSTIMMAKEKCIEQSLEFI